MTPTGTNGTIGSWPEMDVSIIDGQFGPAPEFPLEFLGPFWSDWTQKAASGANASVDYTAAGLLTIAAALIGNARTVGPTPHWREPCIVWVALVGSPSAGKSPALAPLQTIISTFEQEDAATYDASTAAHRDVEEAAKAEEDKWREDARAATKVGLPRPPRPAGAVVPPHPKRVRLKLTDATKEAAAGLIGNNPKGMILFRDELSGWWKGFDQYSGDGERQFWIECYGGRPYTVDRKKHPEPIEIPRLSISILGGVFPVSTFETV